MSFARPMPTGVRIEAVAASVTARTAISASRPPDLVADQVADGVGESAVDHDRSCEQDGERYARLALKHPQQVILIARGAPLTRARRTRTIATHVSARRVQPAAGRFLWQPCRLTPPTPVLEAAQR